MNALRNVSNQKRGKERKERKQKERNFVKFVAHIPMHIADHIQDYRRPGPGG